MTQKFNYTCLVQDDSKVWSYLFGTGWHKSSDGEAWCPDDAGDDPETAAAVLWHTRPASSRSQHPHHLHQGQILYLYAILFLKKKYKILYNMALPSPISF